MPRSLRPSQETLYQPDQPSLIPEPEQEPDRPNFLTETFPAAVRLNNTFGSYFNDQTAGVQNSVQEGYDVLKDVVDTKYEPFLRSHFVGSFNPDYTAAIKKQIDQEIADREIEQASGFSGFLAGGIAALVDWPTLIPGGAVIQNVRGGVALGRTATSMAVAGATAGLTSEAALQATQQLRTKEETAIAVAGGALLSGVFGTGLARYLSAGQSQTLSAQLDKYLENWSQGEDVFNPSAAGAQQAREDFRLQDERALKKVWGINKQDPMIRTQLAESAEARSVGAELYETPLQYQGEVVVQGGPVETNVKAWEGPLATSIEDTDELFARYWLGRTPGRAAKAFAPLRSEIQRNSGRLTYRQFRQEVGIAMREGDTHAIPEVAEAARLWRRNIFDPLKEEAIEANLLPPDVDVKTAQSYLMRVYNREAISQHSDVFVDKITRHFEGQQNKAAFKLRKTEERISELEAEESLSRALRDELAKLKKEQESLDQLVRADKAELRTAANEVTNTILGNSQLRTTYDVAVEGPRGPLKARMLTIPDKEIEEFLESDIGMISRTYVHTMAPDVELTKKFGNVNMEDQIRSVIEDYDRRIEAIDPNMKNAVKERDRLQKQKTRAVRDIEGIRDRIRGTYSIPDNPDHMVFRAGRVLRNLNYLRLLGGMTLSAIPDLARPVMVYGLVNTFRDGFLPMITNFRKMRMAAHELKAMSIGTDMATDIRAMSLAGIIDDYGRQTAFERSIRYVSDRFGLVSLMAPWNAAVKQMTGMVAMSQIVRLSRMAKLGRISAKDMRKLTASNIDRDMATRIADQFGKYGETQGGAVHLPKIADWDDQEAARAFRNALIRDVDRVIVTPGQDIPLFMSTEFGKTMMQFRSFGVASMQRTVIAGLQQRDAAALNGALLMMALGALTYAAKQKTAGRDISDKPEVWATEAFDRSGLSGWLMDVNNITEKFTGGRVGFSRITGEQISRYQSRNVEGAIFGPTVDILPDVFGASSAAFRGDFSQADLHKVRKLIPLQNIFYLRGLIDQVEKGAGNALGLPERRER